MIRVFSLIFFLIPYAVIAQHKDIKITEGTAEAELTKDKSRLQVEKIAEEYATVNALEKAFGRIVVQGNSTYIHNLNSGEKTETNTIFNMIANTSVKGEVMEIISKKFTDVEGVKIVGNAKQKITYVKCDIKIKARELTEPKINIEAYPLSCTNPGCSKTTFKENDDLFFYFKSPEPGYLSIFLDDANLAQCLLPYRHMPPDYSNNFPIEANKEYILFSDSPDFNYFNNYPNIADTYQLFAEKQIDLCRFIVIFTKVPLNKPKMETDNNSLSNEEIEDGYSMPNSLKSEDFQKWKNKTWAYLKENMQVTYIDISIHKN